MNKFYLVAIFFLFLFNYSSGVYAGYPAQKADVFGSGNYFDKEHQESEGFKLGRNESKIATRHKAPYQKSWCYANCWSGDVYGSVRVFDYESIRFENIKKGTKFNADIKFRVSLYGLINVASFAYADSHYKAKITAGIMENNSLDYDHPLSEAVLWAKTNKKSWDDWGQDVLWTVAQEAGGEVVGQALGEIAGGAVGVVWDAASYALDALDVDEAIAQDAWVEFKDFPVEAGKEYKLYVGLDSYVACVSTGVGSVHGYIDFMNHPPHEGDDGGKILPTRGIAVKQVVVEFPDELPYPEGIGDNKADLNCKSVKVAGSDFEVGKTVTVKAKVENEGKLKTGSFNTLLIVNGVGIEKKTIDSISPGQNKNIKFDYKLKEAKKHNFVVNVDIDETCKELDETNNSQSTSITATSMPDLVIQEKGLPPNTSSIICSIEPYEANTHQKGKKSKIWASIYNIGNKDARGVNVVIYKNNRRFKTWNFNTIAAGQHKTIQAFWTPDKKGGESFKIQADPNNTVAEKDESNNSIILTAEVNPAEYDWAIKEIRCQPDIINAGDKVRILVDVENKGQRNDTVNLDVYLDNQKIKTRPVNTRSSQVETFGDGSPRGDDILWQAKPGSHKIKAVIRTGRIEDDNPSDNTVVEHIRVSSDFYQTQGVDFLLRKKNVSYDGGKWKVRVYNRGDKEALAQLQFKIYYVQSQTLRSEVVTTQSGQIPGAGYHDFVLRLSGEDFKMEITADPYDNVSEAVETNNTVTYIYGDYEKKAEAIRKNQERQEIKEQDLLKIDGYLGFNDSLELGEKREIGVFFKNVSGRTLRNIKIKLQIINRDVYKSLAKYGVTGKREIWPAIVNKGKFMVMLPYKAVYPGNFKMTVKAEFNVEGIDKTIKGVKPFKVVAEEGEKPQAFYQHNKVDLAVYDKDFIISNLKPKLNEDVKINIKVRNQSAVDINNVDVAVFADESKIYSDTIDNIEANSYYNISFTQKAEETGTFYVEVRVDPKNKIPEVDEYNNEASYDVKVLGIAEQIEEEITGNIEKKIQNKEDELKTNIEKFRKDLEKEKQNIQEQLNQLKNIFN